MKGQTTYHTYCRRMALIVIFSLCMLWPAVSAFAQKFSAIASAKEVPQNYTFEITYSLENGDLQKFIPPKMDGFDVYGPAQSTNVSIINGRMSKSVSYTYTLQPKKQGEFTIPPATAIVNNKEMKSNPVAVKVLAPQKKPQQSAAQDPFDAFRQQQRSQPNSEEEIERYAQKNMFVRVAPSKTSLYEGDQLTLTYKLYFRVQFQSLQATKTPSYNGFLSEEFKLPERHPEDEPPIEEYNGKKYYVQEFKRVALFPNKTGKIQIEPIELNGVILVEVMDPFFNNPFFNTLEPYEYKFKSNAVEIEVKPLPEKNKPAAFSGAVGKFAFEAQYDKEKGKVGEPLTLTVKYTGTGNLKLITAPKLTFPEVFEAYEPKVKDDYANNGSVVSGAKTFTYTLIPQDGGVFKMPAYEFAYFDTEKKDYVKFTLPEKTITVEGKAKLSENVVAFFKREKEDRPKGIYGIRKQYVSHKDFAGSPMFWVLSGLPLTLLLLGFVFRKRDYSDADMLAMRRGKANKVALKRMAAAKKLLQQQQKEPFYNEVIRALWEYLSDKLLIPQSELSKENIADKLRMKAVAEDKIAALTDTLDTCEEALFSPLDKEKAMLSTYERAIDCIVGFEEHLKNEKKGHA